MPSDVPSTATLTVPLGAVPLPETVTVKLTDEPPDGVMDDALSPTVGVPLPEDEERVFKPVSSLPASSEPRPVTWS